MRALTWQGKRDVRVETVPDPTIQEPTDAIVRITSTAICGSDLHLYEVLAPYLTPGDVLGHEPMGIVEEVGPEVTHIKAGDRVVVPFNISCGSCWMCTRGPVRPVRDHPGPRAGQGRRAVRLHLPVRRRAGRAGRVPAGAAGPLRPDQGPRRAHRPALALPLRHPAHRLAGRGLRRRATRRHARRPRARSGRPVLRPDRPPPGSRARHRRRPRPRAARHGARRRASRCST